MSALEFSQLLGNYGEFVGAIAIVITLTYLAMQLRQNTRAARAQTVQDLNKGIANYLLVQAQSAELGSAWSKAVDGGNHCLSVEEEFYVRGFAAALVYSYQNSFDQARLGTLTDEQWEEYRSLFNGVIENWRPFKEFWKEYKGLYPRSFVHAVETGKVERLKR